MTLGHRVLPRTGYPFEVEVVAAYTLDDRGLSCSVTARNTGQRPAPYGVAQHPYLVAGHGRVDDWTLDLPAEKVLEVTAERLIPTGLRDVAGSEFDFRKARTIGATALDHTFTSLATADDGLVHARVTNPDGSGVECLWDPATLPWVQVHTADLPDPAESRRGLALEPMTCPPDAFNSGTDLVVLEPGGAHGRVDDPSDLTRRAKQAAPGDRVPVSGGELDLVAPLGEAGRERRDELCDRPAEATPRQRGEGAPQRQPVGQDDGLHREQDEAADR